MIVVEGLSKFYHGKCAIENVSFSINDGDIVGLLGLNGAGKSTILKILGCFLLPSGGDARIGGYSIETQPDEVRRMIGYLPDVPPVYPEMQVEAYLKFIAALKNVPRAEIKARVQEAMEKTNISDVFDMPLAALSHGFKQRVGIAQAIVHKPKVIILDEPINGLDPLQIVEMRDLILSLKGQHTVILSSHILSEITKTCDRILVIDRGHLVAEGNEELLKTRSTQQVSFELEFRGAAGIVNAVRQTHGVKEVSVVQEGATCKLNVVTQEDARSRVAATVIQNGGELLSLVKTEEGLEKIFFRLVQHEERGNAL
jgi:ABC-2 type transport system ATP-binding protein